MSWLRSPGCAPTLAAAAGALAFLILQPPVGDLWAARARQSAASHGVGLTYWFSWFGGGSTPGHYSIVTPYLSALVGAATVGALATAAITPLCWRLVRGTNHPLAATWTATVTAGLSLWSGRIPFALGTAVSVAVFIAVREGRRWSAAAGALAAVLISPVCGVFIAFGLIGTLAVSPSYRRISATTMGAVGVGLIFVAATYGSPGPQGFGVGQAVLVGVGLLLLLAARPSTFLSVVVVLAVIAVPLLVVVPNGMGSNFERLAWICLPVAVVATAGIRLPLALGAAALAVFSGAKGTVADIQVAAQPTSSASYYSSLAQELDHLPRLSSYRLEVVADGTHTAAYALLDHAALARGYETQADNALNRVLMSAANLTPVSYKVWLDNNSVGYVALPTKVVHPNPEYTLVSTGALPYLSTIWSNADWVLMRVEQARPIVAPPAAMLDADQAVLEIAVPSPGPVHVRVRWSAFLAVDGPDDAPTAQLADDGSGWTVLTVAVPGRYVLRASATGLSG
ncbi:MAG: hypothetical protein M3Y44_03905 [Actinomycetota bacterium]|nr:hypothetical protein [Actinomycetota bacterium]